ncbi:hypothetical protein JKP88DRAFT_347558 [Tribonema minus]|uniref:Leishmanolysin n=1 Tax=Tribonema minus TaxID=303371 RepID=A0A836CNZ7_9STRA|nr:hypothetical protein JKP88DRAFT_347558 [Tribonema minus]
MLIRSVCPLAGVSPEKITGQAARRRLPTSGAASSASDVGSGSDSLSAAPTAAPTASPTTVLSSLPPTAVSSGTSSAAGASSSSSPPQGGGKFAIQLVKVGDSDAAYDAYMERAKARWEAIIVGDVVDIVGMPSEFAFLDFFTDVPQTPLPRVMNVDDIVIGYQFATIDGLGNTATQLNTLGATAVIQTRPADIGSFPITAGMLFDVADIDLMIQEGLFDVVVMHEMGHALGFSSDMWPAYASQCGTSCAVFDAGAPNGCVASQTYKDLGLPGELTLQSSGTAGDGSYCAHWDEATLGDELMTPVIGTGANPLTAITIAAFEDCGYEVSYATAEDIALISPVAAGAKQSPVNRALRQRRRALTAPPRVFRNAV